MLQYKQMIQVGTCEIHHKRILHRRGLSCADKCNQMTREKHGSSEAAQRLWKDFSFTLWYAVDVWTLIFQVLLFSLD